MSEEQNKNSENSADQNQNTAQQEATENIVNLDPEEPALEEALKAAKENLPPSANEQIAQLQQELLDNRDRTMRALAEAENTRKRAIKDRDDAGKYAIAKFARSLLDFSDNFERALEALPDDIKAVEPRVANVVDGIEAMHRELNDVFTKNGIKKIEPLDEPFDANFHEVMFETPIPGKAAGIIIQVIEPGYVLNDRLLRAAKVGIAKAGGDAPSPTDPGATIDESA